MYAFALFSIIAIFCFFFFLFGYSCGAHRQGKKLMVHVNGIQDSLHSRLKINEGVNAKLIEKVKNLEKERFGLKQQIDKLRNKRVYPKNEQEQKDKNLTRADERIKKAKKIREDAYKEYAEGNC